MNQRLVQLSIIIIILSILVSGVSLEVNSAQALKTILKPDNKFNGNLPLTKSLAIPFKNNDSFVSSVSTDPTLINNYQEIGVRNSYIHQDFLPLVEKDFSSPNFTSPKTTDGNGKAYFELPDLTVEVVITESVLQEMGGVQEEVGQPIQGMNVVLLYDNEDVLAIAEDPLGRYYPSFSEVPNPAGKISFQSSALKIPVVKIEIAAIVVIDAYHIYKLLSPPPEIIQKTSSYVDLCMDVEQVAAAINLGSGIITFKSGHHAHLITSLVGALTLETILTERWCSDGWDHPAVIRIYYIPNFNLIWDNILGPCPNREPENICQDPTPTPTFPIYGKVYDDQTGLGIGMASVQVLNTTYGTEANGEGYYTIVGVPPGFYSIEASKLGYVSQVKDVNVQSPGLGLDFYLTPIISPPPNNEPYSPSNPSPPHRAMDQSTNITLSWSGGDPDGDNVTYDVLFGSSSPPSFLLCNDTSQLSCTPATLVNDIQYFWQVIATDEHGLSTTGPIWRFTTEALPDPCSPLYADDFSDSTSGWPILDDGNRRYEYLNNEYRILVRNPDWAGAGPGFTASDYNLTVDAHRATENHGSNGLLFGLSDDWSQFYTFEIFDDGTFGIYEFNNGNWTLLATSSSNSINTGTTMNRMRIKRNGTLIEAYANGTLLASISDGSYTGVRHVGVFVGFWFDGPDVDVMFDNFAVYPVTCNPATYQSGEISRIPNIENMDSLEPGGNMSGPNERTK